MSGREASISGNRNQSEGWKSAACFLLHAYASIGNTFLPMNAKKRKIRSMKNFLVEWTKGDEERTDRIDKALKKTKLVKVELVRALLDEWAKGVLAQVDPIQQAVENYDKKPKLKKKK